ncbi:unnamed protein product, partial [Didymodactylos carnosus]
TARPIRKFPPNQWTKASNLIHGRYWHTATLLPSGKVLIAGGYDYNAGAALSSCELFDLSTNSSSTTGSLSIGRYLHTATLLKSGEVLVCGGNYLNTGTGGNLLSSCERYNPSKKSWKTTGSLSIGRDSHTATLLQSGKVLICGGTEGNGGAGITLSSCELYDPSHPVLWSYAGMLSVARFGHTATLLTSGNVLICGGFFTVANGLSSCDLYNEPTNSWSKTGSLSRGRYDHTATLLQSGQVLVSGGAYDISICELYDPSAKTWSTTGSLSRGRSEHLANLLPSGKVLVTGGVYNGGASVLSSCELYNPSTKSWSTTGSMSAGRRYHTATLLNSGQVLVDGGYFNGVELASSELYTP